MTPRRYFGLRFEDVKYENASWAISVRAGSLIDPRALPLNFRSFSLLAHKHILMFLGLEVRFEDVTCVGRYSVDVGLPPEVPPEPDECMTPNHAGPAERLQALRL